MSQLAVKPAPNGKSHFVFTYWAFKDANFRFVRRCRPISTGQFHLSAAPANWHLCRAGLQQSLDDQVILQQFTVQQGQFALMYSDRR
jgi:hypothetical protein